MHIEGIINIIKVLIAYFSLVLLVTAFMIKPIVKNRNIFNRIVLYIVVGNFYIINLVFILAYLSIFNRLALITALLLTSVFIRIILDKKAAKRAYFEVREALKHLLHGDYGIRVFLRTKLSRISLNLKGLFTELFQNKKLEWIIFLAIMCYNIYYYGSNGINFVSFAAPDEEIHLYWIQSLMSGHIFPSGVYPYGFHNILGAVTVFYDFHAVTVIRAFGVISMILIMTMLYFGLRVIFKSKYAALLGFIAYSLLNIYDIESVYRFQFAVPQEYGMIMLIPMAMYLFSYLKEKKNSNLVYFGMCFCLTLSIHFYVTIIALVLCLSIGIVYFYRILKNRLLVKLILCGVLSTVVAIAPLAAALAMGNKMEQSMDWAVRVIQGKEYGDNTVKTAAKQVVKEKFDFNNFLTETKTVITKHVFPDIRVFYIFLLLLVVIILYVLLLAASRKLREENLYQLCFTVYGIFLIFLILCLPLKLPTVMEPKRVAIFLAYSSPIYMAMPLEMLYEIFNKGKLNKVCSAATVAAIPILIFLILKYDLERPLPPFYYFQTKGAMLVDCDIIKKYKDFKWTVVSPSNDRNVILNNGWHYELNDFILEQENWNEDKKITIPTKYVFIYIEKRPIALYGNRFYSTDKEIVNRDMVNYEEALKSLEDKNVENINYKQNRAILMSKAYYWALEYKRYFPKEMSVYYEDDEIIVYRIVQNEYALNNFAINYGANVKQ